eukprot:scaffold7613_cov258-Pinguiococcus_pyrenoidosus.AAC.5
MSAAKARDPILPHFSPWKRANPICRGIASRSTPLSARRSAAVSIAAMVAAAAFAPDARSWNKAVASMFAIAKTFGRLSGGPKRPQADWPPSGAQRGLREPPSTHSRHSLLSRPDPAAIETNLLVVVCVLAQPRTVGAFHQHHRYPKVFVGHSAAKGIPDVCGIEGLERWSWDRTLRCGPSPGRRLTPLFIQERLRSIIE